MNTSFDTNFTLPVIINLFGLSNLCKDNTGYNELVPIHVTLEMANIAKYPYMRTVQVNRIKSLCDITRDITHKCSIAQLTVVYKTYAVMINTSDSIPTYRNYRKQKQHSAMHC